MDRNFARALPLVLKHEGGWADHPDDPGGATMKGVTLATFRRYVKADGTKADLRAITEQQVATVYYRHYWAAVNAQALPSGVDYAVFDFAVNSGPSRAAKYLQSVVGAKVDGRVGPDTIAAVSRMEPAVIINRLCDARMAFLRRLKHWPTFGNGWSRRVSDVRKDAMNMVGRPADIERVPVPVPRPTVPAEVEQKVREKSGFWQWLTGLLGSGALGLGWLTGMDWKAIAAGGGVLVVVILVLVILRSQIVAAVREIKGAVEGQGA
ncbi:glycosyl hydrolase 108 family protein [Nitratireductor aquimarinus]|uniref:glycoside hydrolase family 108 protein n=1 Tax=Nitratireductor aquimarinus TaxID=889300 RepID=UPI002935AED4|nr:glycosyl hydrolase 108 family protein [Nitratireductor aquimarinus]MDV2965099.1 glycosyl hydrolase 108 family protein [Nitratireductor aquimarinus]